MSKPLTVIRKLIGAWPRTVEDFHERSSAYAEAEQYEAAAQDLSRALRICAENAGGVADDSAIYYFHFCRGDVYMSAREFEKARADYEEAAEKYGDDFGTLDHERAACLIELGEFAEALQVFNEEDYTEPDPDLLLCRARCLAGLDRPDEALSAFQQSLEQAEQQYGSLDEEACFYRGKFLLEQGRSDEALADLSKALELHGESDRDLKPPLEPWVIEAYRFVGQAHNALGNQEEATNAARRADQLADAQALYRPKSMQQVHREIWLTAAIESATVMIGLSILLWIFGPAAYSALQWALPLPPLPAWWRVVPISLLSLSAATMVALLIASVTHYRPRPDDPHDYRRFEDFN